MSYEVLARRWRPHSFDDVAGQRHVTTTLGNALKAGRLPHAILLAGPRGIGKTTIARILARCLNCDRGPTVTPCGECASCREIGTSSSLDVQEIDAASHTGVDNVREIRESIRYSAAPGRHRIFIIDEVHMLSAAAFNALLKTLEEPPPHSLFIFATTDPQKIPATVLSRVQRFDLKRLPAGELLELLRGIAESEQIEVPEGVLRALVREAEGSARDALTLLDRLLAGVGTRISEEDAATVLDLVDRRVLWEILDPVLDRDPAAALAAARAGIEGGIDPQRLAADLLAELRNLVVARIVDDPEPLIEAAPEEVAELRERAGPHDAETLQRLFRSLLTRIQDLPHAPRPAHAVELAVVRLATLPEAETLSALVERLDALGRGAGPGAGGAGSSGSDAGRTGPRSRSDRRTAPVAEAAAADPSPGPEAPQVDARTVEPSADAEQGEAAPPEASPSQPRARPPADPRELARIRNEAKAHPAVRSAIEILDAEIRDIRPRARS